MQVKTIRQTIQNKIEDWLKSITNDNLRKVLYKDVIVTGGCITSLFLNEKVNDYDVYIRTHKTLRRLMVYYYLDFAQYDIEIFEGIHKENLIKNFLKDYPGCTNINRINNQRAVALRTLKNDQIKYYIPTNAGGVRIDYTNDTRLSNPKGIGIRQMIENTDNCKFLDNSPYRPVFFSPNAISLSDDLQVIIRFWGEADVIHKNYDFIHATNYWTFEQGLVTNKLALTSILTKQLLYQGSLYPVTSILRTKKFTMRGWRITVGEMFKMIYQCSLLDLTNTDVLEEQLIGMDVAYFGLLIEAFRRIEDKSKLTTDYLFTIIDRIFDNANLDNDYE